MESNIVTCPFCRYPVEVDVEWARKNERVFCGTCCKSFPVQVPDNPFEDNSDDYGGYHD